MRTHSLVLPGAIVVAALLIAGAIYFNGNTAQQADVTPTDPTEITLRPVDETDHIRGNPNAPIMLIEYSDYDCPFCSQFHTTMQRVMEKYGTTGEVAWVYRHFPIDQLHPNARDIAVASECVANLGGNDAFWTFTDLVFSEKPTEVRNGQEYLGTTDMTQLPAFAEQAGVDRTRFDLCTQNSTYDDLVAASIEEARAAGGTGTPHTLIVAGNEVVGTIPGAFPFENFRGSGGAMQSGMDEIIGDLVRQIAPATPSAE